MRLRACLLVTLLAVAGCENPQGQTERFLEGTKSIEEKARGTVSPLPALKPKDVAPLAIERDPFRR